MGKVVVMPKLGLTMTEGTVDEWKKNEGDAVQEGEVLLTVSTDKLTNDIQAPASGTLLKIAVPAGETVPVLAPIGFIGGGESRSSGCRCSRKGERFCTCRGGRGTGCRRHRSGCRRRPGGLCGCDSGCPAGSQGNAD